METFSLFSNRSSSYPFQSVGRPFNFIVPGLVMGGERKKSEKARLRKGKFGNRKKEK